MHFNGAIAVHVFFEGPHRAWRGVPGAGGAIDN
jgi:hypothetical protein